MGTKGFKEASLKVQEIKFRIKDIEDRVSNLRRYL